VSSSFALASLYLRQTNLLSLLRPEWIAKKVKIKAKCIMFVHGKHVTSSEGMSQPLIEKNLPQ
jgi:hypothetical protein